MTDKLKPCPFCGATAKYSGETDFGNVARIVHMSNCALKKLHDVFVIGTYDAELWNRRAVDLEALAVEIGSLIHFTAGDSFERGMNTAYRKAAAIVREKANGNNKEDGK